MGTLVIIVSVIVLDCYLAVFLPLYQLFTDFCPGLRALTSH